MIKLELTKKDVALLLDALSSHVDDVGDRIYSSPSPSHVKAHIRELMQLASTIEKQAKRIPK